MDRYPYIITTWLEQLLSLKENVHYNLLFLNPDAICRLKILALFFKCHSRFADGTQETEMVYVDFAYPNNLHEISRSADRSACKIIEDGRLQCNFIRKEGNVCNSNS